MKNYDELLMNLRAGFDFGDSEVVLNAITAIQELQDANALHGVLFAALELEHAEQSRLLGISGSREAALISEVEEHTVVITQLQNGIRQLVAEATEYRKAADLKADAEGTRLTLTAAHHILGGLK